MKTFLLSASLLMICFLTFGQVTSTGSAGYVPKFVSGSSIANSLLYDNGTNVGIGTTTPGAKLEISNGTNGFKFDPATAAMTISGPASNLSQMPRTNYSFNGDPNAAISFLTYAHDNIAMSFDSYHNGTSWISSHAGANFSLYKANNELVVGYNSGTAAGTSFGAFNLTNGIRFSNNGSLGIGGAAGSAKLYVNGNVGIGTSTPTIALDVNGAARLQGYMPPTSGTGLELGYYATGSYGQIYAYDRTASAYKDIIIGTQGTQLWLKATGVIGMGTATPNSNARLDVNGSIFSNSKIVIGTTDMTQVGTYSLAVNGSAIFTKAVVKTYGTWADYVFEPGYKLPPLKEVEEYVLQNKHLSNVPSSAEVEKNGIDLGDNQARLLKKVEELTLYVIELNKKIDELSKEKNK